MRLDLARHPAALLLVLAGYPAALLAGEPASSVAGVGLLENYYTVSFVFSEQGRATERVSEVIRCTRGGFDPKAGTYTLRSDRQRDFQRTLASGHVVSYDLVNFCDNIETNYVFQFSVRRGFEVTHVYPQDMHTHGVNVSSFKVESAANALYLCVQADRWGEAQFLCGAASQRPLNTALDLA
jgi:hypothetical protein